MRRVLIILGLLSAPLGGTFAASDATPTAEAPPPMVVVTTRALRARSIIAPDDVALQQHDAPGGFHTLDEVVGMEASTWLQAGVPVRHDQITPAAVIERNQIVTLVFRQGALEITTEGRALQRAAAGEPVRAMNLESKTIVTGRALPPGLVEVR